VAITQFFITSFSPGDASGYLFDQLEESPRVIIIDYNKINIRKKEILGGFRN
jgi:hypothetical protein